MNEPRHAVVVTCLVRRDDQRILLVRHPRRGWELPQGRVEEGEDLVAAARREVREESGVEAEPRALAAVCTQLSTPPAVIFLFVADYRGGEARPCEECPEVGWCDEETAVRLVEHPVNRDRLALLLNHRDTVVYRSYVTRPFRIEEDRIL